MRLLRKTLATRCRLISTNVPRQGTCNREIKLCFLIKFNVCVLRADSFLPTNNSYVRMPVFTRYIYLFNITSGGRTGYWRNVREVWSPREICIIICILSGYFSKSVGQNLIVSAIYTLPVSRQELIKTSTIVSYPYAPTSISKTTVPSSTKLIQHFFQRICGTCKC